MNATLGAVADMTAAEARATALAKIEAARNERVTGPLMRDFAEDFMRRQARRWKPATRETNRCLIRDYIAPFFGAMRVADIARADVRRWFDGLSDKPGTANRTLPVLSAMMTQAELWDLRPQGSNPCRNKRRYKMPPRERFLSVDELKRLGFVLDPRPPPRSGCCCSPARGPPRSPACGGSGYAGAARCCPIANPAPRRSSFRPRRAPSCTNCGATGATSFLTPGATGR